MNKSVKIERERDTNRAWNKLYNRLEQDGLLADDAASKRTTQRQFTLRRATGIAALFVGVVSVFVWLNYGDSPTEDALTLTNAKGDPTLVTTFEDGSTIYLSEQASIAYPAHFAENKREVSLQGDAFFEVSANRERPFVIHTQTALVEVLGTSFNVKSKDDAPFSLSVRSGRVKVTLKANNQSVFVGAGETALLQDANLQTVPTSDMEQFNAFLRHVYFKDQTLTDVVRIINENTDSVQLKVAPEVGDKRVTITFQDNTAEDMAQIISLAFNLELTKQQNILYIK